MDYTRKDLQIVAAGIVLESEMDNKSVLSLVKFIKNEATDEQLKSIIVTKALPLVVTESFEGSVNEKFEKFVKEGKMTTMRKSYMSMNAAGSPVWLAYRKIRSMADACTKKCGTYEVNTVRRQACYAKCKEAAAAQELTIAKKYKDEKKISKANASLAKWRSKVADYKNQFKQRDAKE